MDYASECSDKAEEILIQLSQRAVRNANANSGMKLSGSEQAGSGGEDNERRENAIQALEYELKQAHDEREVAMREAAAAQDRALAAEEKRAADEMVYMKVCRGSGGAPKRSRSCSRG